MAEVFSCVTYVKKTKYSLMYSVDTTEIPNGWLLFLSDQRERVSCVLQCGINMQASIQAMRGVGKDRRRY